VLSETDYGKKVENLQHRRALLDAPIRFIGRHKKLTSGATLKSLQKGKTELSVPDHADGSDEGRRQGRAETRQIIKSGEDSINNMDGDAFYAM
jgi:hypothetical protein